MKHERYPKYSVLMSVYYKEKPEWLDYSIKSIINQTVLCDEFVIVEDGPLTEELQSIIDKYKNDYPKIFNIVKLEKNRGLGLALQEGIKTCKNEYIARMDSDDYSIPERCEKILKVFMNNSDYDCVGSFEAEFEDNINNINGSEDDIHGKENHT